MPLHREPSFLTTLHRRRLKFPFLHAVIFRDAFQLALPDPAVRPIRSPSISRPDSYNSKFEEEIPSHAFDLAVTLVTPDPISNVRARNVDNWKCVTSVTLIARKDLVTRDCVQ